MTSKEALEELKANTEWTWKDSENYNIVKKDLEVLEILKRCEFDFVNGSDFGLFIGTRFYTKISREEFNKVKEWLER